MGKIEKTIWSPDTCGCKIEYQVDHSKTPKDGEPEIELIGFKKVCEFHSDVLDVNERWKKVKEENQRKNYTLAEIMDNFPEFVDVATRHNGEQYKNLKAGMRYQWTFDENRKLKVRLVGARIDNAKKTEINSKLQEKYGDKSEILLDDEEVDNGKVKFSG